MQRIKALVIGVTLIVCMSACVGAPLSPAGTSVAGQVVDSLGGPTSFASPSGMASAVASLAAPDGPGGNPASRPLSSEVATHIPEGPSPIIYWEEEGDAADAVLDELAGVFMQENPDVVVKRAHFRSAELRDLYRAAALGGRAPDVVRAPGEFAGPFADLGIVQEVRTLFPADVISGFYPGALAGGTVKGQLWGLPDNYGGHLVLVFNRDLVEEVPSATDAWVEQLKRLTDLEQGRYGLVYDLTEPFWLVPWIGGYGGWVLDSADQPWLNTTAMVSALQFVQDLKFVHRVVPLDANEEIASELFLSGKAAYIIDGVWNLERYQGAGLDIGVVPFPQVSATGLRPTSMAIGKYWFIGQQVEGDRLEAVTRFVAFMTSSMPQEAWLANTRRLPSSKEAAQSELIIQDTLLAGSMTALSHARALPAAQEMGCVWTAMRPHLQGVMVSAETPSDAAIAMQVDAEACLAELGAGD